MGDRAVDSSNRRAQASLYRQQWLRLLLIPASMFLVMRFPIPGTPDVVVFITALVVVPVAFWYCRQLKCPRCHDSIMFERGIFWPRRWRTNAAIMPHRECPACLWPNELTPDQHRRLIVEGEYRYERTNPHACATVGRD